MALFDEDGIVNKLVTAAVIGLLGWNVITTQSLSVDVAVLQSAVERVLEEQYTNVQATSRTSEVDGRITRLETTVSELEETVERLDRAR